MSTPNENAANALDHSVLDGTKQPILGSQVDEIPLLHAQVLDGTTATSLNAAATPLMNYTALPYTLDHKAGRILVSNNTGSTINAGDLVYVSGYDSTNSCYQVTKAQAKDPSNTSLYAHGVLQAAILTANTGYMCLVMPESAQDTSGLTAGRPIYLSGTAGGWTGTLPAAATGVQIVGFVAAVSATVGRIVFCNWSIIPWSIADQV